MEAWAKARGESNRGENDRLPISLLSTIHHLNNFFPFFVDGRLSRLLEQIEMGGRVILVWLGKLCCEVVGFIPF